MRKQRYGNLVRGWGFRTYPDLLEKAEQAANRLGMTKTEFIEYSLRAGIRLAEEGRYQIEKDGEPG